ncbi:MAG: vitamin B12 dependent-methionine synthase activation domain-containing protein [Planctomycetota bacterium]
MSRSETRPLAPTVSKTFEIDVNDILPASTSVFKHIGFPRGRAVDEKFQVMLDEAIETFKRTVVAAGMILEIAQDTFAVVFRGEGQNAEDTPLEHIFTQADSLALFAVTMGKQVSDEIEALFRKNEFVVGAMLDAVASLAADNAAEGLQKRWLRELISRGRSSAETAVLGYSPGYCGWHISAQKRLFQYLKPEKIGITLNESCLMQPMKSMTGVLVAGQNEIHRFENNFDFCEHCQRYSCRVRMKALSLI